MPGLDAPVSHREHDFVSGSPTRDHLRDELGGVLQVCGDDDRSAARAWDVPPCKP
jgi:hypothetical protein